MEPDPPRAPDRESFDRESFPEPPAGPVETLAEDHRWEAVGIDRLAQAAAGAALRHLSLDPAGFEVSLLACSDVRIGELNADFRGVPRPTNVLAWPSAERGANRAGARPRLPVGNPGDPVSLGDVALAFETCAREAEEAGVPLAAHATHLIVHGVLHLLGFDHEREADAELMEGLEGRILLGLGHPDPYAPAPP